jgi:hypothetical protein
MKEKHGKNSWEKTHKQPQVDFVFVKDERGGKISEEKKVCVGLSFRKKRTEKLWVKKSFLLHSSQYTRGLNDVMARTLCEHWGKVFIFSS